MYLHCGDLVSARGFYFEVLGLTEIYSSADEGTVGYRVGDLQITITRHGRTVPAEGWAKQMGWDGGSSAAPSWGIEYGSSEFRCVVERARAAGVEAFHSDPAWVGYWSFPVKDPMGHTVEISAPSRDAWPPPD